MYKQLRNELMAKVPPSINALNKAETQAALKAAQVFINERRELFNQLTADEVKQLNVGLAEKNCRLLKNGEGSWELIDRYLAYEAKGNYSTMFQDYVASTDDKNKEVAALNSLMGKILQRLYVEAGVQEFKLIDLGCGDGQVAAQLLANAQDLGEEGKKLKPVYVAVDRDVRSGAWVEKSFAKSLIPYHFHHGDFREGLLGGLQKEQAQFVLASHLYASTAIDKLLTMTYGMAGANGMALFVHNLDSESDSGLIRKQFKGLLKFTGKDYPQTISECFEAAKVDATISLDYDSELSLPRLKEEEWAQLYQLEQAHYDADYSHFSANLLKAKHLIEFTISDRLEAFTTKERHALLDFIRSHLVQQSYVLKSKSKIQVVLAPQSSEEFKKEFIRLKQEIESNQALSQSNLSLFSPALVKKSEEREPQLGFSLQ